MNLILLGLGITKFAGVLWLCIGEKVFEKILEKY